MSKASVDRMAHLLDAERAALLAGDFDAVNALAPQKEALAQEFDKTDAVRLRGLASALARNTAMLAAAKEGVSTVLTTLKAQREARSSLSSYDSNGNAMRIAQPKSATERRF